jgi:biotin carboxyl carrier protein
MMVQGFRCGERQLAVTLQRTGPARFALTVDGQVREVEATLLDAATLQLVSDGTVRTVSVARVGDAYHVGIAGEVYVLTAASPSGAGAADRTAVLAAPQILAPMPGKVLQVLVRVGQQVAAGDGLLILEAMKMEHRMIAEAPATVRAVHVVDGQMVDAGAVLVELEY